MRPTTSSSRPRLGVLRVALHLIHHLGLTAGERGLFGVEAAGVGERVPDVDRVTLVETRETEFALGNGVEFRGGKKEAVLQQRKFHAVIGGLARGRGLEIGDGGLPRIGGRDVVRAGRADAVGRVEKSREPRRNVDDAAERACLAAEDSGRGGLRIGGRPDAGVGRDGFAGGIAEGDADAALQPVLAITKGADEPVVQ